MPSGPGLNFNLPQGASDATPGLKVQFPSFFDSERLRFNSKLRLSPMKPKTAKASAHKGSSP